MVNANTRRGELTVRVSAPTRRPIDGFDHGDRVPFRGDAADLYTFRASREVAGDLPPTETGASVEPDRYRETPPADGETVFHTAFDEEPATELAAGARPTRGCSSTTGRTPTPFPLGSR